MVKKADGSFELTAPINVKPDEKSLYKYVVDDGWCIDSKAKICPDEAGIENNFLEATDLLYLSKMSAIPEVGGTASKIVAPAASTPIPSSTQTTEPLSETTTSSSEPTLETTVIKETQPDVTADPLAAAIGALPGLAVAPDQKVFENVVTPVTDVESTDLPTSSQDTPDTSIEKSLTEDDPTLVSEVSPQILKGNILPDSEIEHVSCPPYCMPPLK